MVVRAALLLVVLISWLERPLLAMKWVRRLLIGSILILTVARLLFYLIYVVFDLATPFEAFHLEAKMVLLAYRVQAGDRLYPDWQSYPYVANFFGPVYFTIVGLIGRLTSASIPNLFMIGRLVTLSAAFLTTLFIAIPLTRRYGLGAALLGASLSIGGAPMYGFSAMVRSDLLAETFGTAGFLLCAQSVRRWRVLGCILLALAVLTKQTTAIFLVASALALFLQGARRDALLVFVGGMVLTVLSIAVITLVKEPRFAIDFLGEGKTPWLFDPWRQTLRRIVNAAPDLILVPVIVLILAKLRGEWEPALLALTLVVLAASLVSSAKRGADLNYYLSLRVCEGLAGGILWRYLVSTNTPKERVASVVAGSLVIAALSQSTIFAAIPAASSMNKYGIRTSLSWKPVERTYDKLIQLAEKPDLELLTDSGLLDLYRRERAAFGDPWLFRMLVETGRIQPTKMKEWIESEKYDLVVTTSDLMKPTYRTYEFGLPMVLVESVQSHYVPAGTLAGFFLYARRGANPTSLSGPFRAPPKP